MPYEIRPQDGQFLVVDDSGKTVGTHPTRKQALIIVTRKQGNIVTGKQGNIGTGKQGNIVTGKQGNIGAG